MENREDRGYQGESKGKAGKTCKCVAAKNKEARVNNLKPRSSCIMLAQSGEGKGQGHDFEGPKQDQKKTLNPKKVERAQ